LSAAARDPTSTVTPARENDMDEATRTEIEAAVFRRLRDHLMAHPDVQNIDLMNTADFCRNCLAKWYRAAAEARGEAIDYDRAREIVYGMPYEEYKTKHQKEASPDQKATFQAGEARRAEHEKALEESGKVY